MQNTEENTQTTPIIPENTRGEEQKLHINGSTKSSCPPEVLAAIYGNGGDKKNAYENSLRRWWTEYADRKNDEDHEYVANSLLYDRNTLPRTTPAPDCVFQQPSPPPDS